MHWNEVKIQGFTSEDEATNFSLDHLRERGYSITLSDRMPWETVKEFRERLGISTAHWDRRMKDQRCPWFQSEDGPSGRIIKLRSNPDFEKFMQKR